MLYLVDGNNVMALQRGWHRDKAAARRKLISDLSVLAADRNVKVSVVFDGAPDDKFPEGSTYKKVRILYARAGSNADTRIKNLVRRSSFKRDMTVVTSDREVAAFSHRQGTKIMTSSQFRHMINEAKVHRAESEPMPPEGSIDVEDWLDYFRRPDH